MSGEPSPKRQRTEEPTSDGEQAEERAPLDPKIQKVVDAVAEVETEIEAENDKLAKEILKLESKYNKAKRPAVEKRGKLLSEIPGFWKQAIVNHPLIGNLVDENDQKILEHLTGLDVTYTDDLGSFKIELTLSENAFLSNTSVWKQITFADDDETEPTITASEFSWKESDEAQLAKSESSFFDWFSSTEGVQDIAEIIKDDLFKSPVQYYLQLDDEDDEDVNSDGDEEDDEEDEEDDEEAAKEE